MRHIKALLALLVVLYAVPASAATITVCTTGCPYTDVQSAINAAAAGDTILLEEGHTYTQDITLPVKAGAGPTAITTIRTGVNSVGVVQPTSRYPAAGIRICPSTYVLDWYDCSTRNPQDMTRIASLKPSTANQYGVMTASTGSGTAVSYYTLQWLRFIPNTYAGNSLIGIVNLTINSQTGTSAMVPHHIVMDQIVLDGDDYAGQYRGIQIDGVSISVTNSMLIDIKSTSEGQGITMNGFGPVTLTNNYVCCATENTLTGGGGTYVEPTYTVQASPAPTTTVVPFERNLDLWVEKPLAFMYAAQAVASSTAANPTVVTKVGHNLQDGWQVVFSSNTGCVALTSDLNAKAYTVTRLTADTFSIPVNCATGLTAGNFRLRAVASVASIAGNTITVTPALPLAPAAGDTVESSTVLNGVTMTKNVFTHPQAWRSLPAVIALPTGTAAVGATTGGTLAAGSYCYRVEAEVPTAQGITARSGAAVQACGTVASGTTGSVTSTWVASPGAVTYRVYGRVTGAQDRYFTVTAPTTAYTDTGSAGTVAAINTDVKHYQVKNSVEFKQGINLLIEGNIIEESHQDAQSGPCFLLTVTTQGLDGNSALIRDVIFRNNIVRHCGQFAQVTGADAQLYESGRTGRVSFINNLWYDSGNSYAFNNGFIFTAGGGPRQYPLRSTFDLLFNHNTIHSESGAGSYPSAGIYKAGLYFDQCETYPTGLTPSNESLSTNFDFTNNIIYAGFYHLSSAIAEGLSCAGGTGVGRFSIGPGGPLGAGSTMIKNVVAGGNAAHYGWSTNTYFPTVADVESLSFTGITTPEQFILQPSSTYHNLATDGTDIGAIIPTITAFTAIAESGNDSGGPPVPPEPPVVEPIASWVFSTNVTAPLFIGPVSALKSATTTVDVSAATAPTTGQVLTAASSTSATWVTPTTGTTGNGYALYFGTGGFSSPADSTTYYIGAPYGTSGLAPTNPQYLEGVKFPVPKAGTVKTVVISLQYPDSLLPSTENITFTLMLNGATGVAGTPIALGTLSLASAYRSSVVFSGLSQAVVAGDVLAIKMVTPAWVTNPTAVTFTGHIYIE